MAFEKLFLYVIKQRILILVKTLFYPYAIIVTVLVKFNRTYKLLIIRLFLVLRLFQGENTARPRYYGGQTY